jgi:hypothetical protein
MIVLLMGLLPVLSIALDVFLVHSSPDLLFAIGRWFVFWAGGARLFLAGIKQIIDPAYTAETIFSIEDKGAQKIVQELGFGNVSIGLLGMIAGFHTVWIVPAALASGLFYGLAGGKHILNIDRTQTETFAMVSDVFMFAVLAAFLVERWVQSV